MRRCCCSTTSPSPDPGGDLHHGCDAIAARSGLVMGVVGHVGDGNMHPTVVVDATGADQRTRAFEAVGAILQLGGTVTGEQGMGTR